MQAPQGGSERPTLAVVALVFNAMVWGISWWPLREVQAHGLHFEAIAIETPAAPAQARFLQQWPEGSDAHASYFSRIAAGPAYREADVIRWET